MKRTLLAALLAVSFGCATAKPEEKVGWSQVMNAQDGAAPPPSQAAHSPAQPAARAPAKFDPRQFNAAEMRPVVCEDEARRLLAENPDHAWKALKLCAKNPSFIFIRELLSDEWMEQLKSRSDAIRLLARVVANRGGSIEKDVELLNEKRLPLFTLGSAMSQPKTYKSQYVLVRAKVSEMRAQGEATTVRLTEYSLGNYSYDVMTSDKQVYNSSSRSSGSASASASGYVGSVSGSVSGSASSSRQSDSTDSSYSAETRYDNVSSETGRFALGRLSKPDPFLKPGKEFVVLARFEGVRTLDEDSEEPVKAGILTVVEYFEPNPLVVF